MTALLTFCLGLVVGACAGVLVAGLCAAAAGKGMMTPPDMAGGERRVDR